MNSIVYFSHGQSVGWPNCWHLYGMTLDEGHYYNYFLWR